jgi:hypothetical protein
VLTCHVLRATCHGKVLHPAACSATLQSELVWPHELEGGRLCVLAEVDQSVVLGLIDGSTNQTFCQAVLHFRERSQRIPEELHDVAGFESGEALRKVTADRSGGIPEPAAESAIPFQLRRGTKCIYRPPKFVRKPPTLKFSKVSWRHADGPGMWHASPREILGTCGVAGNT